MTPKTFIAIFFTILVVFVFSASMAFWLNYNSLRSIKKIQARDNAYKIYSIINENFNYAEKILSFIGHEISRHNNLTDLTFIHNTFVSISQIENTGKLFSWSRFDWVDRNNMQTVNTLTGINTKNPQDMSIRGYTKEARLDPWKLKLVAPLYGHPSGVYVIPVGVGTTSEKGNYMGLVVAGISIKTLVNKIIPSLDFSDRFLVIDMTDPNNPRAIFGSVDLEEQRDLNNALSLSKSYLSGDNMLLNETISYKHTRYLYKLSPNQESYPYIILAGYDVKKFWHEFYLVFMPVLIIMSFITILLEALLVVIWIRGDNIKKSR
jgi:hypothetical protein